MTPVSLKPVSLLLLSGGVGSRSEHHEPKQFFELCGHPLMAYAIIAATKMEPISEILINAPEGYQTRTQQIMENYSGGKSFKVLPGGKTRQESSYILAQAAQCSTILLHETARPFVNQDMYQTLLDDPEGNAGYFQRIAFSMCQIDIKSGMVDEGVSREKTFEIQLPQKFNLETLLDAHKKAILDSVPYNEDSVMVASLPGANVSALTGFSRNLKVTTKEDFLLAESLMKSKYDN